MVHKYERLRHISTGRFGAAFLIKADGRLAMMKTIDIGRLDNTSRNEAVEEVKNFALLRHPHISAIRESFIEGGHLCLVMEYAEGGHAMGQIEKARRTGTDLQEPLVMKWFTQATLGLKHMHDRSVIHRDVRTRKLLLTSAGHVVLTCPAITPLLRNSLSEETPDIEAVRYLSPQIVAGGQHSTASDMWALGVVLYELVALAPPFDCPHPRSLAERILSGPSRNLPKKCSSAIQHIGSNLLSQRADDRFTTSELLCQPLVQESLWMLFNAEPTMTKPNVQPRHCPVVRSLGKAGFGSILLKSPAATPRGLMQVGEQVSGVKCGKVGTTGNATLLGPRSQRYVPKRPYPSESPQQDEHSAFSTASDFFARRRNTDGLDGKDELATEHAKMLTGIMVETTLDELNFSASHVFEDNGPSGRWSMPTCVDMHSGATWYVDDEIHRKKEVTRHNRWDAAPLEHKREFPRFT